MKKLSILMIIILALNVAIPQKSEALVPFVAYPLFLGALQVAGVTAASVAGAYMLYNQWYSGLNASNKSEVDIMNTASTVSSPLFTLGLLQSVYTLATALTPTSLNKVMMQPSGSNGIVFDQWIDVINPPEGAMYGFRTQGVTDLSVTPFFPHLKHISTSNGASTYHLLKSTSPVIITHYATHGNLKVKWLYNSDGYIDMDVRYFDYYGNMLTQRVTVIKLVDIDMFKANGYLATDVIGVKHQAIAITDDAWKAKERDVDGQKKYEVPAVPTDGWSSTSKDAVNESYGNSTAADALTKGYVADGAGTGTGTGTGSLDFNVDTTGKTIDFSPLFVDLSTKFPFSIPWDVYNAFASLSAPPQSLNYTVYMDLGQIGRIPFNFNTGPFDGIMVIIRGLETAIFAGYLLASTKKYIWTGGS